MFSEWRAAVFSRFLKREEISKNSFSVCCGGRVLSEAGGHILPAVEFVADKTCKCRNCPKWVRNHASLENFVFSKSRRFRGLYSSLNDIYYCRTFRAWIHHREYSIYFGTLKFL